MKTNALCQTETLADYISTSLHRDLPADVAEKVKHHTLDTLAAAISGATLPAGCVAHRFVDAERGSEIATVISSSTVTTAINAAFANAMMAHADETDDTHQRGRLHPGATIIPVAVAGAEAFGRSGSDMMRAIALGYDIAVRFNLSLGPDFLLDKRHSTH